MESFEEKILFALQTMNMKLLRKQLNEISAEDTDFMNNRLLMHNWIKTINKDYLFGYSERRLIIYMICNAGYPVDATDEDGNTMLHLVMKYLKGDPELCEPLLQAGADLSCKNNMNEDVCALAKNNPDIPKGTKELLQKYSPGLFKAIELDDLLSVRKLVNLWCRVDIEKDGQTLKTAALSKGTENIIRLILQINSSMQLAHAVLAEDPAIVKKLLEADEKPNVNFRNLGDLGATPLFYAIQQNSLEVVSLLIQHGARANLTITLDDEDIPILFTALSAETDADIIRLLIPSQESGKLNLENLHYRGDHVLQFCIKNSVGCGAVRHILQQGYSSLVALRNCRNECARDLAVRRVKTDYVKIIDEVVHEWYLDNSDKHRRQLTALGYEHLREAEKDGVCASAVVQSMETSSPQAKFDTQLSAFQDQVDRLMEAIVAGDLEKVVANEEFVLDSTGSFETCLCACLQKGNGQPALHKAVLRGNLEVAEHIIKTLLKHKFKVDSQMDQFLRTPLHYAYALENSKPMVNLLMDYGASEFAMDKDLRSPLVFKDYQGHPVMNKLLQWLKTQDFSTAAPDPFTSKIKWQRKVKPSAFSHHMHHHSHPPHHHNYPHPSMAPPHFQPPYPPQQQVAQYNSSLWSYCAIL